MEKNIPPHENTGHEPSFQADKRKRELWLYLSVSIAAVEVLIFVACLLFGFIATPQPEPGKIPHIAFPWLSWAATSIIVPSIILLAVHMAVGLFTPRKAHQQDEEWGKHLPERLQKAYSILMRAPAIVLLGGIIGLGATLLTLDGALQALENLLLAFKPYLLHTLAGVGLLIALFGVSAAWLSYRTRRLYAEYEYRREVLEKTGLIIVDHRSQLINPADSALSALPPSTTRALTAGNTIETTIAEAATQNDIEDAVISDTNSKTQK